jgi:hypothetical protein
MARDTFYSAKFPAGQYYVGDLCYVMHPEWDELCDIMFSRDDYFEGRIMFAEDEYLEGELNVQNKRIFLASTAWGDGNYADNVGRAYGVDSGSLGIIAVENIAESELPNLNGGNVIEFTTDFIVTAQHGRFNFGGILIDTGYNEEYDEGYNDDHDYNYDDYESQYETDY